MVRLMEERGLRRRLVANRNRKPRVSIKRRPTLLPYRFMDVVTEMDCCPGDSMLLHKACFCLRDIPDNIYFIQFISYVEIWC